MKRAKDELTLKKNFPEVYEAYEIVKKINRGIVSTSYPSIFFSYEKNDFNKNEDIGSFMIDFSISYAFFFQKRKSIFNKAPFSICVGLLEEDQNYNYPKDITKEELTYWLPRLAIKNLKYEQNLKPN